MLSAKLSRSSQISKITSTPRTSPIPSASPSISTIEHHETSMDVDNDNDLSDPEISIHSDDMINTSVFENVEAESKTAGNIKWTGPWSTLKPKNKNSLYYKIFLQPQDLDDITVRLLNNYREDPKSAIISILQLFVDLCGYKKVNLDKYYNFENQNSIEVIGKLETVLVDSELKKTGKFIFMKVSKFASSVLEIITKFVRKLVYNAFKNAIIFDEIFTSHLFQFLNCMAFSVFSCIRVTGVILATTFLTAFLIYNELFEKTPTNGNISPFNESADHKKSLIENIIDFLYRMFDKNCLIPEKKCYLIKIQCAKEIGFWIKFSPESFIIKRKCLGRLLKLVLDYNPVVRKMALNTCEIIIDHAEIVDTLKQRMEIIITIVTGRIVDVDTKVAVKAITVLTKALHRYSNFIKKTQIVAIVNRMFEKDSVLANAAGKFLAAYLPLQHNEYEAMLVYFANIAFWKKEFAERLPHLLECTSNSILQLHDISLFLNIIQNDQVSFPKKKHILDILNEILRYSFTGKFSKSRIEVIEDTDSNEERTLTNVALMVRNFGNLLYIFQEDKYCLKKLVEILTLIEYNWVRHSQVNQEFYQVLITLKALFKTTADEILLQHITTIFLNFWKNNAEKGNYLLGEIKKAYSSLLLDDIEQLETVDRTVWHRLRESSMKLSVIFSSFDLSDSLTWNDIFKPYDSKFLKVFKYVMVCCKWYLIWSLRKLLKSPEDNSGHQIISLKSRCEDFVSFCLNILQQGEGTSDTYLICELICDLYISFDKELGKRRALGAFLMIPLEDDRQKILIKFTVDEVIFNEEMNLKQRGKLLTQVVYIIYLEIVPIEHLASILKYYHTHYDKFGAIFDAIFDQLNLVNPALPLIIIRTLTEMYLEIRQKYGTVNISSSEGNNLKKLAKCMAKAKYVKSSVTLKLVTYSITFAFKHKENFAFLYIARYFAKQLQLDQHSDAYHYFLKVVPDEQKNNDIILLFASIIKPSD